MSEVPLDRRNLLKLLGAGVTVGGVSGSSLSSPPPASGALADASAQDVFETAASSGPGQQIEVFDPSTAPRPREESRDGLLTATSEKEEDVSVEDDSPVEVGVLVSPPTNAGFGSDDTADIWVSAYEPSDPVPDPMAGESLEVTVDRPDEETDSFSVETDDNGRAHVGYDLSQYDDGDYDVEVERVDGDETASVQFTAGLVVDITNNRPSGIFVDEATTVGVLVRNGEAAESGEPVEVTVDHLDSGDDPLVDDTFETDDDGFVDITFVPEQTGRYSVEATLENGTASDFRGFQATAITLASGFGLREAVFGHETTYGGYLRTADGQLANTDVELTIQTDPFGEDPEPITEGSATTDENGFFLFPYEVPEDLEEDRLQVEAETADGTPIHVRFDRLRVDEFTDTDPDPGPDLQLTTDIDTGDTASFGRTTGPGGEVTIEVEATDDGDPVPGEEVHIVLDWDFSAPPMFVTTITTDEDGVGSTTFTVPENAPDDVSPRGEAVLEVDDETVTDSLFLSIEEYNINFSTLDMDPGDDGTLEIEVVDQLTEDPVQGVPVQYTLLHAGYKIDAIETGQLVSDSEGDDSTTVPVPEEIGPSQPSVNYVSRYDSTGVNRFRTANHPGSLSVENDDEEFTPGDTVTFSFDTESDASATGIVFSRLGRIGSFGTTITSGETASVELPAYSEGQFARFRVWAFDGDGFYEATESISVGEDDSPVEEYVDDESGKVETDGVRNAVDDWLSGDADTELLQEVIDAWASGEPIA